MDMDFYKIDVITDLAKDPVLWEKRFGKATLVEVLAVMGYHKPQEEVKGTSMGGRVAYGKCVVKQKKEKPMKKNAVVAVLHKKEGYTIDVKNNGKTVSNKPKRAYKKNTTNLRKVEGGIFESKMKSEKFTANGKTYERISCGGMIISIKEIVS